MLVSLAVRDFVLIDGLTLELSGGLNVLTGETGAGKSILVDALALVLGGRARPEVVRTGRDAAEVEALFDLSNAPESQEVLRQSELLGADPAELVIRRVAAANGRSKAFVNGRLVTAGQLQALTRGLVDVSSQHESQTLCDPATHADLLDVYAALMPLRAKLQTEVEGLFEATARAAALRKGADALASREDFLRFQLKEIEELDPQDGELDTLESLRGRLRHSGKLAESTRNAANSIDEGDDTLLDRLRRVQSDVASASILDPSLADAASAIEGAIAVLADTSRDLARYSADVESDPDRLAQVEDRLYRLQKLARKHGGTLEDVLRRRGELDQELAGLSSSEADLATLEADKSVRLDRAVRVARELSRSRSLAAFALGAAIAEELASLAMGRARIVVEVAPIPVVKESDDTWAVLLDDGTSARLTRAGLDRVELLIAPNPGEDPRPLRRIASGGELSRALLAVKRVLAKTATASTYVFDEVDAGVGGAVGETIGRKIADVAKHHQVLCITHLPQIAAFADTHFAVSKREDAGRTQSEVRKLTGKTRLDELARMLGGTVTKATRAAADEMLSRARG